MTILTQLQLPHVVSRISYLSTYLYITLISHLSIYIFAYLSLFIYLITSAGEKIKNKIKLHFNFILFYCPYFYFYFLFTTTAHAPRKILRPWTASCISQEEEECSVGDSLTCSLAVALALALTSLSLPSVSTDAAVASFLNTVRSLPTIDILNVCMYVYFADMDIQQVIVHCDSALWLKYPVR